MTDPPKGVSLEQAVMVPDMMCTAFEGVRQLDLEYGASVAVLGIGVSNRPLIGLLCKAGACVTACDKKTREQLGDTARQATPAFLPFVATTGAKSGVPFWARRVVIQLPPA